MDHTSEGGEHPLPRLKGAFPFRLAATSYIIPAPILPNVRFLGPHLDEVELVLFESGGEDNLPSEADIRELARLGRDLDLTYNVHLPTDLFYGDPDPAVRRQACSTAARFYRRTLPIDPTAYILHLDRRGRDGEVIRDRETLLSRFEESLTWLIGEGLDPSLLAVENLDYPLEWIAPVADAIGMKFCLDLGHLIYYGFDRERYLNEFLEKTGVIHLHGVLDGADHRGADAIPELEWKMIFRRLDSYRGGLSLEVFSLGDLRSSMVRLEGML
jgi:sugar phosphate isomerase/epimerase